MYVVHDSNMPEFAQDVDVLDINISSCIRSSGNFECMVSHMYDYTHALQIENALTNEIA